MRFTTYADVAAHALFRRGRYLDHYGIDPRSDWDLLKTMEETGEILDAHVRLTGQEATPDSSPEELLRAYGEELADLLGFLPILSAACGVDPVRSLEARHGIGLPDLPFPDLLAAARAHKASLVARGLRPGSDWEVMSLMRAVGLAVKSYVRLTGQSRPTGLDPDLVKDEMANRLADVLIHLTLAADAVGMDLAHAFAAKWGAYR